jgi:hypothetical protein
MDLRRHGLALGLFTVLAIVLTWPLVSHFATHVTGDGIDDPALAWNLWWVKARLVDQVALDIFHVGWMFHPIDINLAFYTLTPLNGLLSVPLQAAFSLVVANNLLLLSSFVLGAFGAYLLALDQLRAGARGEGRGYDASSAEEATISAPRPSPLANQHFLAALAAGVLYAFASSKLFYASLGQVNIASSQWAPFCVLYLVRMVQAPSPRVRLRSAAMAALFLVFQAWAELTFASFLLIFALLLFVFSLIISLIDARRSPNARLRSFARQAGRIVLAFFVVGALFLVGIAPILAAMLPDMRTEGDFFSSGGGFADLFSADLFGYLVPTRLHPLLGEWVATLPFPNDKGQHIYVGYAGLLLVMIGLVAAARQPGSRRWVWFWLLTLATFWLLTLGPQVRWLGEATGIPGPFALVSQLPFFSGNRYPSRYSVMLLIAVAVCASWGVAWLLLRVGPQRAGILTAVVVVIFLGEHLSTPLPLNDFAVPPIYRQLAAAPVGADGGVLLELPTGWRNGARVLGRSDILIMMQQWYQTTHALRRLGGNTSRNPDYKLQYFTEAPVVGDLIALMNADRPHIAAEVAATRAEIVARGKASAAQVLDFLGVDYVTVHVEHAPAALLEYVETVLPVERVGEWRGTDWSGAPATIRLYRFTPTPAPSPALLSLANGGGNLYLGAGWSPAADAEGWRLAQRAQPALLLDLPASGATVRLTMAPAPVAATVNGAAVELRQDGAATLVDVPAGVASEPVDAVQLQFAGDGVTVANIGQAAGSGLPIGATGQTLPAASSLLVRSAGEEVGDFAHIYLGGRDVAANARGYNLVALSPAGGLLASAVFDTFADVGAAQAMAAWLAGWPAGTIIAGAVADEASMLLDQAAVDALRSIGVATDLRGRFRWSHAFVGAVGAAHASALEQANLLAPATVFVGAPASSERVFGRLQSIEIFPMQGE